MIYTVHVCVHVCAGPVERVKRTAVSHEGEAESTAGREGEEGKEEEQEQEEEEEEEDVLPVSIIIHLTFCMTIQLNRSS